MTMKNRIAHDPAQSDRLDSTAWDYIHTTYSDHYAKPFRYALQWTLDIRYRRITLVAKDGGERMTIDTGLAFTSANRHRRAGSDMFIVETKSALGRGFADRALRRVHERPIGKCSKYCIGMAALGEVSKHNLFLPAMRKLGLVAGPGMALAEDARPAFEWQADAAAVPAGTAASAPSGRRGGRVGDGQRGPVPHAGVSATIPLPLPLRLVSSPRPSSGR